MMHGQQNIKFSVRLFRYSVWLSEDMLVDDSEGFHALSCTF
jgi:hypothetical protein